MAKTKERASSEHWIACAVCFVQTGGDRKPAVAVVNNYSVCEDHVTLATRPGFNISSLASQNRGSKV